MAELPLQILCKHILLPVRLGLGDPGNLHLPKNPTSLQREHLKQHLTEGTARKEAFLPCTLSAETAASQYIKIPDGWSLLGFVFLSLAVQAGVITGSPKITYQIFHLCSDQSVAGVLFTELILAE